MRPVCARTRGYKVIEHTRDGTLGLTSSAKSATRREGIRYAEQGGIKLSDSLLQTLRRLLRRMCFTAAGCTLCDPLAWVQSLLEVMRLRVRLCSG